MSSEIMVGDLVQPDEAEKLQVLHVTSDNLEQFSISDVVMTMPGFVMSHH